MLLFVALSILLTGHGDGASGRQFAPLLPAISGAQIQHSGFRALTQGGRACFPETLDDFYRAIKRPLKRTKAVPHWALHTPTSWILSATQASLLPDVLQADPSWHAALDETWQHQDLQLRCVVLKTSSSAEETHLNKATADWEIRWLADGTLPRLGHVTEVARPAAGRG